MTNLERVLEPGCPQHPECLCGSVMPLSRTVPSDDTEIQIFQCAECGHELHLTVWREYA
jgi:hypothetical protein